MSKVSGPQVATIDEAMEMSLPAEIQDALGVRATQRNVKRWQNGDMRKRWTAAGMLVAEAQFRRIIGYSDLARLVIAIERHHLTTNHHTDTPSSSPTPSPPRRSLPSNPSPDRCVSAKARPEELRRLDRAFAASVSRESARS